MSQISNIKSERRACEARMWKAFSRNASERNHEALWNWYQPLVRHVVARISEKMFASVELTELLDAGNVGLLDAIAEFAPVEGARFELLAVPRIREAIDRSLAVQRARENHHVLRLELAEAIALAPEREICVSPEVVVLTGPARRRANAR